jgi:hypothetical protein
MEKLFNVFNFKYSMLCQPLWYASICVSTEGYFLYIKADVLCFLREVGEVSVAGSGVKRISSLKT